MSTTSNTCINLSGLFQGTNYQFRIRSICGQNVTSDLSDINVFSTPGTSQCDTPTSLQENNITSTSADLSWTDTGANAYDIQYRSLGSFDWITIADHTSSTLALSNLTVAEDYQWRVRSICSANRSLKSNYSTIDSFQTFSNKDDIGETGNDNTSNEELEDENDLTSDDASTATSTSLAPGTEINLYPNPASDIVNISLKPSQDGWYQIILYDLSGQTVRSIYRGPLKAGDKWNRKLSTQALKNGLYSLVFSAPDGTKISKKIIIQH